MPTRAVRHDRILGAVCVVACPVVTGLVLALVTVLCVPPGDDRHAFAVAARVGVAGFAINLFAIAVTALAVARTRSSTRARRADRRRPGTPAGTDAHPASAV